ncbi:hypothetical protein GYA25_00955 [Candidatus Woesearchaeota archaeon]|jgi:hypothetical protein|nr:hypothetical protein [Candidatus Woesearchaeota archaeon]
MNLALTYILAAIPYLISSFVSVIFALMFYTIPYLKKIKPKYLLVARMSFLGCSLLTFVIGFLTLITPYLLR